MLKTFGEMQTEGSAAGALGTTNTKKDTKEAWGRIRQATIKKTDVSTSLINSEVRQVGEALPQCAVPDAADEFYDMRRVRLLKRDRLTVDDKTNSSAFMLLPFAVLCPRAVWWV